MIMKCTKAQDLYFLSRDNALDDARGIELARHLVSCPECALFVSLNALRSLPDVAAPEGFEWNVKRRILQEKSKLMRSHIESSPFGGRRWMSRFAFGAAAAAIIVCGAVFSIQRMEVFAPRVREIASSSGGPGSSIQIPTTDDGVFGDYAVTGAMSGTYAGPRMVSDNIFTVERSTESVRQSPFQFVSGSREDSLARENELLKRRVRNLERQILLLNSMLDKERMQRINMSLP
jgi:hypothetical protein